MAGNAGRVWRRYAVETVLACLLWGGLMAAFGHFLKEMPVLPSVAPPPVEAELVELPPVVQHPERARSAAHPPAAPRSPHTPVQRPVSQPHPVKPVPRQPVRPAPHQAMPEPDHPRPLAEQPAPAEAPVASEPASPPAAETSDAKADTPSEQAPASSNGPEGLPGGGQSGARAVYRPMPPVPEDVRQETLHTEAVARFRVAADGSATVELLTPTPNLKLNRFLLSVFRTWRFEPAMTDGKAQASEITIRVPIAID